MHVYQIIFVQSLWFQFLDIGKVKLIMKFETIW